MYSELSGLSERIETWVRAYVATHGHRPPIRDIHQAVAPGLSVATINRRMFQLADEGRLVEYLSVPRAPHWAHSPEAVRARQAPGMYSGSCRPEVAARIVALLETDAGAREQLAQLMRGQTRLARRPVSQPQAGAR